MVHENYQEMLAPYALTALDHADARTLEQHLDTCRNCRRELDEWYGTVAALALTAAPAEPSPQVRVRILESVRAERSSARHGSDKPQQTIPTVIPFQQTKRLWNSTQKFGALAAGLAFLALLISVPVLWKHNRSAQAEIARLSAERASAQQELDRQRKVLELLSTRGASLAVLSGTAEAPNAHATLTYDRQSGQAVLLTEGLPSAPRGKAYQLWFIVGNQPMPGRVFTTDAAGKAILSDQIPSQALNAAVFAVTLEPEHGVRTPTGPILLRSTS